MTSKTIAESLQGYLESVTLARSANTARTYRNALQKFAESLAYDEIDPERTPIAQVSDEWLSGFLNGLKAFSPATERLYVTAVMGWYEYLAAERLADINLPRLRLLIKRRARRPGIRLPQFPRREIERVLQAAEALASAPVEDEGERLRALRDRAFLLTLADTGLRVHEACNLRRGDLDIHEGRAILVGKGDRQAVVRFSQRALKALRDYIGSRAVLDGASGRPLASLPVFARHDLGAGSKVLPMTTTTGRAIVHERVRQTLGAAVRQPITPHTFRHYFVTTVLRGSGGNLKLAQELARHRNIAVTQRYAHLSDDELDRGYYEIFDAS